MVRKFNDFGLFNIAIVLIVMGVLAAIVIPPFVNGGAISEPRDSRLPAVLQTLRGQIELYRIQHADTPPALSSMWSSMVLPSNITGMVTTGGRTTTDYPLGPYMFSGPINTMVGNNLITGTAAPNYAWQYTVFEGNFTVVAIDATGATLTY